MGVEAREHRRRRDSPPPSISATRSCHVRDVAGVSRQGCAVADAFLGLLILLVLVIAALSSPSTPRGDLLRQQFFLLLALAVLGDVVSIGQVPFGASYSTATTRSHLIRFVCQAQPPSIPGR